KAHSILDSSEAEARWPSRAATSYGRISSRSTSDQDLGGLIVEPIGRSACNPVINWWDGLGKSAGKARVLSPGTPSHADSISQWRTQMIPGDLRLASVRKNRDGGC